MLVLLTIALAFGRDENGAAVARPHGDAIYHYVYLPSIWLDGDADLANQYDTTGNPFAIPDTPTGRAGNVYGVGAAIFESPLFVLGHGLARLTGARADGFSSIELALVAWASVLATTGALWFAFRLTARRLGDERRAFAAAALVLAAGPVLFFAVRQPGLAHPFATLFTAWLIDAWDESYERERTARTWLVLGVLYGCAVLARPQLAPWGICLVAAAVPDLRAGRWKPVGLGALAAFACVLPQLLTWNAMYGSFVTVPQGPDFMRWDAPAWSEVLFSSRNGLFPWSPLYAVALVGLGLAARRLPRLVGVLVAGFAMQVWINGAAWDWWGGASLGARRFDSTYVAFVLGLGAVLVACRGWRLHVCAVACGWLALGNVVLAARTTPERMPRYGGEAAAAIIERRAGTLLGAPVGWASSLANLPARAAFALRHDTDLGAYDRIVGVHWLADTYPGITTRALPAVDRRQVDLEGCTGRVLIPLNLRGRVTATVSASEEVAVTWDEHPERGVNVLTVRGPPGCTLDWVELAVAESGR